MDRAEAETKERQDKANGKASTEQGAKPAQAGASHSSGNATKSDPGTKAKPGHNGGPRVLMPATNPVKAADVNAKTWKPAPAKLEGVSAVKRPGGQQTAVQGLAKRQPAAPLQPAAATAATKKLPASASQSTDRKKPSGARVASTSAPGAVSNFFGSMQVTAKKQPPPGRASAPAPAAVSFNFMELADQVRVGSQAPAAPAATSTAAPQPAPHETPEQREARLAWEAGRAARRLRAQARNATKVVWADDRGLELLHVKTFSQDPAEMLHDVNLTRDVGNVGDEGRMFKQMYVSSDPADENEDDLGDQVGTGWRVVEEKFGKGWRGVAEYDLSHLGDERLKKLFVRDGGDRVPESRASREEDQHEANEMMALYLSPSDIPPTPQSPKEVEMDDAHDTPWIGEKAKHQHARLNAWGGSRRRHRPPCRRRGRRRRTSSSQPAQHQGLTQEEHDAGWARLDRAVNQWIALNPELAAKPVPQGIDTMDALRLFLPEVFDCDSFKGVPKESTFSFAAKAAGVGVGANPHAPPAQPPAQPAAPATDPILAYLQPNAFAGQAAPAANWLPQGAYAGAPAYGAAPNYNGAATYAIAQPFAGGAAYGGATTYGGAAAYGGGPDGLPAPAVSEDYVIQLLQQLSQQVAEPAPAAAQQQQAWAPAQAHGNGGHAPHEQPRRKRTHDGEGGRGGGSGAEDDGGYKRANMGAGSGRGDGRRGGGGGGGGSGSFKKGRGARRRWRRRRRRRGAGPGGGAQVLAAVQVLARGQMSQGCGVHLPP